MAATRDFLRHRRLPCRAGLAVPSPAGSDEGIDPKTCQVGEIEQRLKGFGVGRAGLHPLTDDGLMRTVGCDLRGRSRATACGASAFRCACYLAGARRRREEIMFSDRRFSVCWFT
jgi:hypothetical protein